MADQTRKHKEADNIGHNQPTSLSSTPKKRHRRMTDGGVSSTQSSASSSPMMSCEPVSSSSSHTSTCTLTSPSTCTSPTATPRVNTPRFPFRIGITWKKGEKLEAMDFSLTWYPSKIVDIDAAAKCVLIHFEGWNQRYDEWVPMDSEKLRPVTRHSERKDKGVKKRRINPHPIFRPGEQVLAKWTDCKKYPAKISRLKEDGMYEVIFYDGVTRLIQPINMQPMTESMKNLRTLPPDMLLAPRMKPSFKQIKVSLPESVKRAKEKLERKRLMGEGAGLDKNKIPEKSPALNEKSKGSSGSVAFETMNKLPGRGRRPTTSRILQRRKFQLKKSSHTSSKSICLPSLDRDQRLGSARISMRRLNWKTWKLKKLLPESSTSAATRPSHAGHTDEPEGTSEVAASSATTSLTSSSNSTTGSTRKSVAVKIIGSETSHVEIVALAHDQMGEQIPSCSHEEALTLGPKRTKKRSNTVPHLHTRHKKVRSKSKDVGRWTKRPPMLGQTDRAKSLDLGPNIASPPAQILLPMPVFVPSKAFIVEEDHNPFKCPHQGCNKDFRKESLLAYHIKYYHTEVETAPQSSTPALSLGCDRTAGVTSPLMPPTSLQSPGGTPGSRKRRKKTSSICSTDSDVSISSKGRYSSKRQHHDSEISVTAATSPDVLNRDLWADVKPLHTSLDSVNEEFVAVDTEDEEMEADVVNCVCGHRETDGLMIQCDVCMCWQHFACVDTDNSGVPPTNYVCHVCEQTPGIRDSCRYMYDMGWERQGELPSFPFVTESSSEHLQSVACECNDMTSALLAIKSALHSTRRQIKISKEDADPEFQLWQTDWDNWTKAEEDLTLTPRSGDPDPSPTPSTFLFPQAPGSNTVTLTVEASSLAVPVCSDHILTSVPHVSAEVPTAPSSSQIFHKTLSLTTATSEVAPLTSSPPPLLSQVSKLPQLTETLTSSTSTSPACAFQVATLSSASSNAVVFMPPQPPSARHNSSLTSIQAQAKDLVQDQFSDISQNSFQSLSSGECMGRQTESSSHKTDNGHHSLVDQKLTAESDCRDSNKLQLLSGSRQLFSEASATSQPQEISSVTSQPQGMSSVTSQSQGISSITNQSQGMSSITSQSQGMSSVTNQPQGISSAPLSDSSSVHNGASIQDKAVSQDGLNNRESTVTSSGLVTSKQTAVERQDQVSSSNGHENTGGKTVSTIGTGTGVGDVNSHMTSLYVEVSGGQGLQAGSQDDDDDDDAPDNDTDTAEESLDPYRNCEHNLLIHVSRVHSDIDKQLEALEQQLTELENSEHNNPTVQLSEDNILNDVPALKKSLNKLHRNLVKVQRFCVHH